jgi:hypothetical protein
MDLTIPQPQAADNFWRYEHVMEVLATNMIVEDDC